MQKGLLVTGILLGAIAVVLGAFGAHGLRKIVSPETVATYQTGVQYQMYHALALILVAILSEKFLSSYISYAGIFFILGILFFSGSLYLIVGLQAVNKVIPSPLGILTPIGGLFFIIGWVLLLVGTLNK